MPACVLARWQSAPEQAASSMVLPDGCSDLILHRDAQGQARWMLSPLAQSAYEVPVKAHEQWLGYRLQPGAVVDGAALLAAVRLLEQEREAQVLEAIDACVRLDGRVQEALAALAGTASVRHAAAALGVSERSLERLSLATTGQPPRYWRALARVRRAAQALGGAEPLAAIAADHGFADQAHFSRECRRWLGQTPSGLRKAPALLATVAQAGYG
ncbi:AraC family transcriptional regulator [Xylophilus sp. ASV27]|uniref:AraC family transcriptional regulator n=1 Tax=Xylophilus sp. ASV27 TaxID=2795129 RepID=UPI001E327DE9|nr:helix-turn-helix domain-containing protein [Xylophilus sp. ASV27]